jgi:hypothetical protein
MTEGSFDAEKNAKLKKNQSDWLPFGSDWFR